MSIVKELEGKKLRVECLEKELSDVSAKLESINAEHAQVLEKLNADYALEKDNMQAEVNKALESLQAKEEELVKVSAQIVEKDQEIEVLRAKVGNPEHADIAGAKLEDIKAGYAEEDVKKIEKTHCEIFDGLTGVAKTKYYQDHKDEILKELGSKK